MKSALIIGGGFAGCSMAHQLALLGGWKVTLVESAPYLGAGVRTRWYGGHPYTFGPRHFISNYQHVFEFLNKYIPLRRLEHEFITYVESDHRFYNFPIHRDDLRIMPDRDKIHEELKSVKGSANARNLEEYWISSVGPRLYEKFVKKYNHKMWMVQDNRLLDTFEWSQKISITVSRNQVDEKEQLPKGPLIKDGPRAAYDDIYSAYPFAANGYDDYFAIATEEADVLLSRKVEQYDIPQKRVVIDGEWHSFDIIVSTIAPDEIFYKAYGELAFVGRDLHKIVLPIEQCFPGNVFFLYYANEEQFTRLVEFKKFTLHKAPTTLIGMEIPSMNGRFYPLPVKSEQAKAQKYFDEMPEGVFSIGRAGSYDYNIDIAGSINQAMGIARALRA